MSQRDYRILIGTAGWQHPEWGNEVFYPEDLPKDWYLSFYSNEFPVVLVTAQQWSDVSTTEQIVDEMIEQASEGFKCVFELNLAEQESIQTRLALLQKIENTLSGLLVQANHSLISDEKSREQLADLSKRFNVCLDLNGEVANESLTAFCEQHAISLCWRGEQQQVLPDNARLWLARCNSNEEDKAVVQCLKRSIAEQLKLETPSREHVLIIDGSPPSIEVTRNANIMLDIM